MSCSVPFGVGRALPINVLEQIAEQLVVARSPIVPKDSPSTPEPYLYDPPSDSSLPPCLPVGIARLAPLLAVSKPIYAALSPGYAVSPSNGDAYPLRTELYARLCAYFLDVKAAGRRWRYAKRRKAGEDDGWDRDVEGVTNEGLTAHFVQVVRVLKFFKRAAKAMGIPLPAQAFEGTPPEYKGKSSGGIAHLYHDNIETFIVMTFVLMLEDDGKNHHQLRLVSAPLFVDMLVIYRLNECTGTVHNATAPPVRFNDGWPVENVLNTAAVWCVWLFTTEEKVHSENVPMRETMIRLVLPFVLCPYRYASALVPPTHYTLPLPERQDVYQKPCSSQTAHGPYPVYHSFPPASNLPPPVIVSSRPAGAPINPGVPVAAPAPVAPAQPHVAAAATAAALAVAPQQHDEAMDVDEQGEAAQLPTLQAGPDAPPVAILHNEDDRDDEDEAQDEGGAGPAVQAPNPAANASNPAPNHPVPPTNNNPPPPGPTAAANVNTNPTPPASQPSTPPPGHTIHISRRPPPTASNSQAHPSYGVYIPWYCSPWKEHGGAGLHQHIRRAWRPPTQQPVPTAFQPAPGPTGFPAPSTFSSSPNPVSPSPASSLSSSSPVPTPESMKCEVRGIIIHLPLITAAAKLIFMSRREAVPLPVIPTLPADRAAARAAGWMYAGPTQEDLREMGAWCTWGRRMVWPKVVSGGVPQGQQPAQGGGEENGEQGEVGQTVVGETTGGAPGNAVPKVEEKALWYADSQRWDTDWWRARLCGGSDWQNKFNPHFLKPCDTLNSPPSLYKTPHESLASRLGRVYERGMLTGLWQGYMHMPNESSLMYVARTRQFPGNFGEQALGVMMRPVLVRFAEHTWMASPVDPGRHARDECPACEDEEGVRRGCAEGYWERGVGGAERVDEEGEWRYEYPEPKGAGPVPVAKATTMVKHLVPPVPGQSRTGFVDENMNNAWFPGPVGSLRWADGSVVPNPDGSSTRHVSAEEGVWDGVWRDRYASQLGEGGEEKRLKMKSVTFSVPATFERGEGIEIVQMRPPVVAVPMVPPPPQAVLGAAAGATPVAAGVAVPANNAVALGSAIASATPEGPAHMGARVVTRLDNPNLPYPVPNPAALLAPLPRAQRPQRTVVPASSHTYETYDPSGVREGVHERMERARGSACRGVRKRIKRKSQASGRGQQGDGDNGVYGWEEEDEEEGEEEVHVYPHPGCLECRERECIVEWQREEVVKMRRDVREAREEREEEDDDAFLKMVIDGLGKVSKAKKGVGREVLKDAVKSKEVEGMFESVGLGLKKRKGGEDEEDEDEEMMVEEFGLDAEDEDEDMDTDSTDSESEDDDCESDRGTHKDQHAELGPAKMSSFWGDESEDDDSDSDSEDEDSSDLESEDDIDLQDSTVLGSCFPPCDSKSAPGDAIVTGSMDDRHAEAWGSFAYYGRVRPWDGLIGILRVGTREEHMGTRFFFYGYVYGGRNFVGNWRFASLDPASVGMESSFVLSRRGE